MAQVDKKYLDLTGLGQLITKLRATASNGGTHELVAHPVTTAVQTAGAYKVSVDANGHVTLGTTIAASDIGAVPTSRTIAGLNLSSNITAAALAQALGITGAMNFIGISSTDPKSSSGATVSGHTSWTKGDVVLYKRGTEAGYEEYIATADDNAHWELLGDADDYALKTVSISAGTGLEGGGTLASNRTISHAAGAQAAISTPGLYKIGCDALGHVIIGTAVTSTQSDGAHTHSVSGTATVPANTYVTAVNTKGYSWSINKGTNNANVVSVAKKAASATTIGSANVGAQYTHIKGFHVNNVAKNAYTASYDSDNCRLTLTPLSLSTDTFYGATASSDTIYGCADEVSVLKDTATISVSNPSTGAQATLAYDGTKNSAASLNVSGTAASDGAHTHNI